MLDIELKKDPEFESLIQPLTESEYTGLEESILNEGVRDPLITWNGFIIDGHNRFNIAEKHGIPYATVEKVFASKEDAKVWMIDNQLGRRNISDYVRFELESTKKSILLERGKAEKSKAGGDRKSVLSTIDKSDIKPDDQRHNTREIISENLGWSTGKVAMAEVVANKAPEEVKKKLRANEMSINEAYQQVRTPRASYKIQAQLVEQIRGEAQDAAEALLDDELEYAQRVKESQDARRELKKFMQEVSMAEEARKERLRIATQKVESFGQYCDLATAAEAQGRKEDYQVACSEMVRLAQDLGEILLDFQVEFGQMLSEAPKDKKEKTIRYMRRRHPHLTKLYFEELETLARNIDLVEIAKAEARKGEDWVTYSDVLKMARQAVD